MSRWLSTSFPCWISYFTPLPVQLSHTLFLAGMSLLLLDFFTGGIGVAGGVGCGSLLFGCYGLGVLDVRMWALVLLVVAMLGFAVDLQTGVPDSGPSLVPYF